MGAAASVLQEEQLQRGRKEHQNLNENSASTIEFPPRSLLYQESFAVLPTRSGDDKIGRSSVALGTEFDENIIWRSLFALAVKPESELSINTSRMSPALTIQQSQQFRQERLVVLLRNLLSNSGAYASATPNLMAEFTMEREQPIAFGTTACALICQFMVSTGRIRLLLSALSPASAVPSKNSINAGTFNLAAKGESFSDSDWLFSSKLALTRLALPPWRLVGQAAFATKDVTERVQRLRGRAAEEFEAAGDLFAARSLRDAAELLHLQQSVLAPNPLFGSSVIGMSVTETLGLCFLRQHQAFINLLLKHFKVPPRRCFWIQLRVLLSVGRFVDAEKLATDAVRKRIAKCSAVAIEAHRLSVKMRSVGTQAFAHKLCAYVRDPLERADLLVDIGEWSAGLTLLRQSAVASSTLPTAVIGEKRLLIQAIYSRFSTL